MVSPAPIAAENRLPTRSRLGIHQFTQAEQLAGGRGRDRRRRQRAANCAGLVQPDLNRQRIAPRPART
jgi:hypothetical protein